MTISNPATGNTYVFPQMFSLNELNQNNQIKLLKIRCKLMLLKIVETQKNMENHITKALKHLKVSLREFLPIL